MKSTKKRGNKIYIYVQRESEREEKTDKGKDREKEKRRESEKIRVTGRKRQTADRRDKSIDEFHLIAPAAPVRRSVK